MASLRTRDVYRPSSVMSSRAASPAGMLPEEVEEEIDQEGLGQSVIATVSCLIVSITGSQYSCVLLLSVV